MNILFLSRWFPFPADNGSRIRIHNLLQGLSRHHKVTLLSFYDPGKASLESMMSYPFCAHIDLVPWKPFDHNSRKARLGLFSVTPRSLLDTYSPQMDALIRKEIASRKYDLVIASQLTMASYCPAFQGVPALFEEAEFGLYVDQFRAHDRWKLRIRYGLTWFKLRRYISRLLHSFTTTTVVSEREAHIFTDTFPSHHQNLAVFPNCINMGEYRSIAATPSNDQIIFTGSFRYGPNYQAMQWFLEKVYPLILEKRPAVQLVITGDTGNLPLPPARNVTLAGHVNDIKSLISSSTLSIAPIWSGGGTRLKILESMALGVPVVSTTKGAEGLLARDGEHLLIADDPQCFAEHVLKLLNDFDLRARLSSNAQQLVRDHYDWQTSMPAFLALVERAAVR